MQDKGNRVELLRRMLLGRHFDEKVNDLYAEGKVRGTTRLYVGQGLVAVGAIAAPREGDRILIRAEGEDTEAALVGLISTQKE